MNKALLSAAAIVLLNTSVFAIELNTEGAYAGGALALESIDPLDSGIAVVLTGGVPFEQDDDLGPGIFALETELTYSLISPSVDTGLGGTYDLSLLTLGAYAAYIYEINEQIFVKPRLGLIYKTLNSSYGGTTSASASEIGLALGLQGGYKLNDQIDITVGLNLVDSTNITHLTVGMQYHY
ncbi:outer membrane beta-barrel protein [Sulfurimonas sp. MAG313]|nr:outer membrane beta-barrel protein [Sulfurimonas sp. MAG313]MDF1880318.1 outer membrane beta-barrel protein [Sulfurimonas sp. MAG313]